MAQDPHTYWNSFYEGNGLRSVPTSPSAFAEWSRSHLPHGETIWEFGFGNARDSLWLAEQGYVVRGFDFAEAAVDLANAVSNERRLDARFQHLDLNDAQQVEELLLATPRRARRHIYGRFLIHALEDSARCMFFDIAAACLGPAGKLLMEFRTDRDAETQHIFGDDHYRTFLDPALVIDELTDRGAKILEHVQGYGMAVYKTEDPHVARIVASWR